MAVIFGKTNNAALTRKAVASAGREVIDYTFQMEPWNVIKVGFFYGFVDPNAPSNAGTAGALTVANLRDNAFIGLRKYDAAKFPIENSKPFVGWKTTNGSVSNPFSNSGSPFFTWTHRLAETRFGVHHPNGTIDGEAESTSGNGLSFDTGCNESLTSAYCRFEVIYFEVVNKGQANQQIILKKGVGTNASTDTSQATLQSMMNSTSYTYSNTLPYNLSGAPYELPDSVFFYLPWTTVGNCIHNIAIQKIS